MTVYNVNSASEFYNLSNLSFSSGDIINYTAPSTIILDPNVLQGINIELNGATFNGNSSQILIDGGGASYYGLFDVYSSSVSVRSKIINLSINLGNVVVAPNCSVFFKYNSTKAATFATNFDIENVKIISTSEQPGILADGTAPTPGSYGASFLFPYIPFQNNNSYIRIKNVQIGSSDGSDRLIVDGQYTAPVFTSINLGGLLYVDGLAVYTQITPSQITSNFGFEYQTNITQPIYDPNFPQTGQWNNIYSNSLLTGGSGFSSSYSFIKKAYNFYLTNFIIYSVTSDNSYIDNPYFIDCFDALVAYGYTYSVNSYISTYDFIPDTSSFNTTTILNYFTNTTNILGPNASYFNANNTITGIQQGSISRTSYWVNLSTLNPLLWFWDGPVGESPLLYRFTDATNYWNSSYYTTYNSPVNLNLSLICMGKGTLIEMWDSTFKRVENIVIGDFVKTTLGCTKVKAISKTFHNSGKIIPQGYFGSFPAEDLYLSNEHAFMYQNKWYHARCFPGIKTFENLTEMYHIETEDYATDVIFISGLPSETWGRHYQGRVSWKCNSKECIRIFK